jgi:hypothetical protein
LAPNLSVHLDGCSRHVVIITVRVAHSLFINIGSLFYTRIMLSVGCLTLIEGLDGIALRTSNE